uniref:hypothetical protein n=1 Tax=Campylobacter jejuni TaxID=197 RepID=UPI00352AEDD1
MAGFVDTFRVAQPDGDGRTFHGFDVLQPDKIDYILADGAWRTLASAIHSEPIDGRWPSDHFAVSAEVARVSTG